LRFDICYELLTVIISEFFFMSPIEKQVYCRLSMAKRTKAQRSAAAKKAARTRKRNAAAKKSSKSRKRKSRKRKR